MKKSILFILLFGSLTAFSQIRQQSNTEGFSGGVHVGRLGWASDYFSVLSTNAGNGFCIGADLGYGVNQMVEPYLSYDYSSISTSNIIAQSFSFSHFDAGLRVNFAGTVNKLRPFVQAGYGLRSGSLAQVSLGNGTTGNLSFSGGTPHVGGGVSYFIKPNIALNLKGVATFGSKAGLAINGQDFTDRPDVNTFRILVGVTFNLSDM